MANDLEIKTVALYSLTRSDDSGLIYQFPCRDYTLILMLSEFMDSTMDFLI